MSFEPPSWLNRFLYLAYLWWTCVKKSLRNFGAGAKRILWILNRSRSALMWACGCVPDWPWPLGLQRGCIYVEESRAKRIGTMWGVFVGVRSPDIRVACRNEILMRVGLRCGNFMRLSPPPSSVIWLGFLFPPVSRTLFSQSKCPTHNHL